MQRGSGQGCYDFTGSALLCHILLMQNGAGARGGRGEEVRELTTVWGSAFRRAGSLPRLVSHQPGTTVPPLPGRREAGRLL